MFLGWVFNALYIGFVSNHINKTKSAFFVKMFYVLQAFVIGMLISFPLQGYGLFSIAFSTFHMIGVIVFSVIFFCKTKRITTVSVWYARVALIFFITSTVGPFSLGYLMANGMGHSVWYYFSIYFYLHFQYNGFFLFGVFSLLFSVIERKKVLFDQQRAKLIGMIMAAACVPGYLLSVLWSNPGLIFNIVAGAAAAIQLMTLIILLKFVMNHRQQFESCFSKLSNRFLMFAFSALSLKLVLQMLSSFPAIAQMAYEVRPIVIAYLHLVLLGVISISLFVWYLESNLVNPNRAGRAVVVFISSFVAMEICMVASPWWGTLFGSDFLSPQTCIFFCSIFLSLGCFLLYASLPRQYRLLYTFGHGFLKR
jgi:hypothetical protein